MLISPAGTCTRGPRRTGTRASWTARQTDNGHIRLFTKTGCTHSDRSVKELNVLQQDITGRIYIAHVMTLEGLSEGELKNHDERYQTNTKQNKNLEK